MPAVRLVEAMGGDLFAVAVAIFIFNATASPYFLNPYNLSDATFNFTEKAIIAFAMALLIIAGEIDLSVASIIALSSTAMGAAAAAGSGPAVLVVVGMSSASPPAPSTASSSPGSAFRRSSSPSAP